MTISTGAQPAYSTTIYRNTSLQEYQKAGIFSSSIIIISRQRERDRHTRGRQRQILNLLITKESKKKLRKEGIYSHATKSQARVTQCQERSLLLIHILARSLALRGRERQSDAVNINLVNLSLRASTIDILYLNI